MGRRPQYSILDVRLNGRLAGAYRSERTGATSFEYAKDWLDWEHAFPISRQLPLITGRHSGPGVLAVFENLLPDSDVLRRQLAERTDARSSRPFDLLAEIGRDCVGALQFVPQGQESGDPFVIEAEPQSDAQIAETIRHLGFEPLGIREGEPFRISIAGAQEKTAYLNQNGRWLRPLGLTPTSHIFKRPMGIVQNSIDLSDSVENEHLCMVLAGQLGLPVARTEILQFEDQKVLSVERFDRTARPAGGLLRLPQEDFLQALGLMSGDKYQQHGGPSATDAYALLMGSAQRERDLANFFRSQLIFWLLGASDGHAKNYSIHLGPFGYRMTPFYDILSGVPAMRRNEFRRREFQMAMSAGKNRHYRMDKLVPRHFDETAEAARVPATLRREVINDLADQATRVFAAAQKPIWVTDAVAEPVFTYAATKLAALVSFAE